MLGRMTARPAPAPLEPLTEDWERALCVVAHPDDLEFGGAAAVARWTGQGKQVVYCMVTSGEAGIDGLTPDECREVREAEQVESARIVGVDEVDFLGLPDGILEYGVPLRRAIAEEVRLHRPDIVITNNFRDSWGGRQPQPGRPHRHRQGRPGRRARRRQPLGLQRPARRRPRPVGRRQARCGAPAPPTRRTPWTSPTPSTSASRPCARTRAYIDGLGWEDFDPAEFLEGMSRSTGQRLGVAHAVGFEVFPMGWGE